VTEDPDWSAPPALRSSYVVAPVVPELQPEVFLLQQLQMAAHFVEEVASQHLLLSERQLKDEEREG